MVLGIPDLPRLPKVGPMLEALTQAQQKLDAYNARWPNVRGYELVRASKNHPAVHIILKAGARALCGTLLHRDFTAGPEGGKRLCDRCRKSVERRW